MKKLAVYIQAVIKNDFYKSISIKPKIKILVAQDEQNLLFRYVAYIYRIFVPEEVSVLLGFTHIGNSKDCYVYHFCNY